MLAHTSLDLRISLHCQWCVNLTRIKYMFVPTMETNGFYHNVLVNIFSFIWIGLPICYISLCTRWICAFLYIVNDALTSQGWSICLYQQWKPMGIFQNVLVKIFSFIWIGLPICYISLCTRWICAFLYINDALTSQGWSICLYQQWKPMGIIHNVLVNIFSFIWIGLPICYISLCTRWICAFLYTVNDVLPSKHWHIFVCTMGTKVFFILKSS